MQVAAVNPATGEKKILLDDAGAAWYVPTDVEDGVGHIVYWRTVTAGSGSLFAVPFDAKRLQLRGSAVPVVEGVRVVSNTIGYFGFSEAGTLAYVPSGADP